MGLPVMMENDATACLMAGADLSRMDGVRDAVLVAVGEGVEPACWPMGNSSPDTTEWQASSAILVDPNGPPCGCGQNGCWEVFSSRRAALRYRELSPEEAVISFPNYSIGLDQGDSAAAQALATQAMWIGRGLRMAIASVSPSTILIAGDLTSAWHRFPAGDGERSRRPLPGPAVLSPI